MPDGDGLGLVLYGVDGPGQLVNGGAERLDEVSRDGARSAHLAHLGLIALHGQCAGRVPQQRRHPGSGGSVEVAVVGTRAQAGQGRRRRHLERWRHLVEHQGAVVAPPRALEQRPRLAERPGLGVYRQGSLVAENVADHRSQHEGELRMARRYSQDVDTWVEEIPFALGNYHHRRGFVGTEYFYFLGDVAGIWPAHARCAHNDERFGRKIDMFFVLDDVEGYRLVAQLRKFYTDLGGRHMVRPAADDGPRTTRRRDGRRYPGNFWPLRKHLFHQGWKFAQGFEDLS